MVLVSQTLVAFGPYILPDIFTTKLIRCIMSSEDNALQAQKILLLDTSQGLLCCVFCRLKRVYQQPSDSRPGCAPEGAKRYLKDTHKQSLPASDNRQQTTVGTGVQRFPITPASQKFDGRSQPVSDQNTVWFKCSRTTIMAYIGIRSKNYYVPSGGMFVVYCVSSVIVPRQRL
ncbi:hypothetical protein TNCV_3003621 [Trichonephila clavipes]|nr:hypothetical protein TNCV_3003621 [Trichonephila clavipes]